jgi:hypothetical protein
MAKPEDFGPEKVKTDEATQAQGKLYEGAYIQRVADESKPFVQIMPKANTGVVQDTAAPAPIPATFNSNGVVPLGAGTWRQVHKTETWPTPAPATWPGPVDVQHNGNRLDLSRTPGTTVFQPRPTFDERPIRPNAIPHIPAFGAEVAQPVLPRDSTGRTVGPTIIGGGDRPPVTAPVVPADAGRAGGLIDRNRDGVVEDERSEKDKGIASMRLLLMSGGFLAGMMRSGLKGAAIGTVIGLVGAEVLRPLNPFK